MNKTVRNNDFHEKKAKFKKIIGKLKHRFLNFYPPMFDMVLEPLRMTLEYSELCKANINDVVLVGTRIPRTGAYIIINIRTL